MRGISKWVGAVIDRNLGRCPKCMRQAFLAAIVAWALTAISYLVLGELVVTIVAAAVALGTTALWVAHLMTYAARVAAHTGAVAPAIGGQEVSRRELLPVFTRALGGIALATALPAAAMAGECDCSKCSSDQYCCPTANGYCGCFPMPCP